MNSVSIRRSDAVTAVLPDSAEALQQLVRRERRELRRSLRELESSIRGRLDVRARLLEHPVATIGVACAAGFVLGVMHKRSGTRAAGTARSVLDPGRDARPTAPTAAGPLARVASTVTDLVVQRLADRAEETLRRAFGSRTTPEPRREAPVASSTPGPHHD